MVVALALRHLPRDRVARALEGVHPDDRGQQRRAYDAAASGRVAFVQRSHHAVGAVHAGEQVTDRHADPHRVARARAGQRHQAALTLGDLVIACAPTLGSVVAEAADREHDQPRVEGEQLVHAEPEPVEDTGAEVLDQHVGLPHQPGEQRLALVGLEVGGDRLLVAVAGEEVRRLDVPLVARPGDPAASLDEGGEPRVSSPPCGFSTLMTRAPRSPSIIAACGPARARVRSTTTMPSSAPAAELCMRSGMCAACLVRGGWRCEGVNHRHADDSRCAWHRDRARGWASAWKRAAQLPAVLPAPAAARRPRRTAVDPEDVDSGLGVPRCLRRHRPDPVQARTAGSARYEGPPSIGASILGRCGGHLPSPVSQ